MSKAKARHVVAAITFPPKSNHGPMACACGWSGDSQDFQAHRAEQGLRLGDVQTGTNEFSYGERPVKWGPTTISEMR